ncbi:MAG: hypothetical protein K6T91_01730 [Firmicutes bacterium]|nr:hypothetical protein [Bacillota bacterium]
MRKTRGLFKLLGGVSFALLLLLIYVVVPLGILYLILSEPVTRLTASMPNATSANILSGGIFAIAIAVIFLIIYLPFRK